MKQSIYILAYKPENYLCDVSQMNVLECGSDLHNDHFGDTLDNTGDNISLKNKYYVETTGIYWIWKNDNSDIKGHMQYRRFLSVNPYLIQKILENNDIIFANKAICPSTLIRTYMMDHNINDLLDCEKIIKEDFKEYNDAFDNVIKFNNSMYYSNSFICKKETYNDLCKFCFGVLEKYEQMHKFTCFEDIYEYEANYFKNFKYTQDFLQIYKGLHPELPDLNEYQSRVFGYLFERLINVYVVHNKLKIYECGEYITNIV